MAGYLFQAPLGFVLLLVITLAEIEFLKNSGCEFPNRQNRSIIVKNMLGKALEWLLFQWK
jgi:hypothetical protein